MAPLEEGGAGLSAEDAMDVIMFEQSNLDLVESIVRSEGIEADFWRGSRVEVGNSQFELTPGADHPRGRGGQHAQL